MYPGKIRKNTKGKLRKRYLTRCHDDNACSRFTILKQKLYDYSNFHELKDLLGNRKCLLKTIYSALRNT